MFISPKPNHFKSILVWDFPGGPVVKNVLASAGDTGSVPGLWKFHMSWGN